MPMSLLLPRARTPTVTVAVEACVDVPERAYTDRAIPPLFARPYFDLWLLSAVA